MKRKIILAVAVLIVVGAIIAYRMYSKQVTNYANENPDFTITAQELVQAFDKDTASASRRFMDKVVRVSGTVKSMDSSAVVLGEEGNLSDVVVGLDDRNSKDIKQIKVGQTAILQGKISGYNSSSGDGDDLISSLGGTTVNIDYAGVVNKH